VKFTYSMDQVAKNNNDSIFTASVLSYQTEKGKWDSIGMELRARGNFRRKNCFFAPLKIKLKKDETKKTLFAGNKSLKLVLPCRNASAASDLVMKEYICYQLYQLVTNYYFKTRLLNVTLTDISGKHPKSYPVVGFFIEDDDLAAKRLGGKAVDSTALYLEEFFIVLKNDRKFKENVLMKCRTK